MQDGQRSGNILMAEDDPDIREALSEILESQGFAVTVAMNGRDVLDRLAIGDPPHAILLDLMMPLLNGFELLQTLHQDRRYCDIPVIVTTANQGYDRDDLGTFAVLRKPIMPEVLLACLRAAVFSSKQTG